MDCRVYIPYIPWLVGALPCQARKYNVLLDLFVYVLKNTMIINSIFKSSLLGFACSLSHKHVEV